MRYLLLDGNHLAGRCWATMSLLTTSKGVPSGVVHGVLKNLLYLRREHKIDLENFAIMWDGGHAEWRKKLYPEYKGNRYSANPTPEEIASMEAYRYQLRQLKEILHFMGVRTAKVTGMEADDLLGIYANFIASRDDIAIIHSGDHDMHQLAAPKIWISNPKEGIQKEEDILSSYGIDKIEKVLWLKCMWGDKSDNVPGVRGLGEVKALKVLKQIEHLDATSEQVSFLNDTSETKIFRKGEKNFWLNMKILRIPKEPHPEDFDRTIEFYEQLVACPLTMDREKFASALNEWEIQSQPEEWL